LKWGFIRIIVAIYLFYINSFNVFIAQWSRTQLTTPVSPLSQGRDKMRGKNLPKLVLMKLVLVKTGNGEKKFLHSNTIDGKTIQ